MATKFDAGCLDRLSYGRFSDESINYPRVQEMVSMEVCELQPSTLWHPDKYVV